MMEDIKEVEIDDVARVVKVGKNTYTCYDLTYGFLLDVETGKSPNTKLAVVMNGTDMSEEDIKALRIGTVDKLYNTITHLTYPDLYDENGVLKVDLDAEEDAIEGDKKKA